MSTYIRYIMHHSQELMSLRSDGVCRPHTWHVNVSSKDDRSEASSALVTHVAQAQGGIREPEGSKTKQNTSMALVQYFGTQLEGRCVCAPFRSCAIACVLKSLIHWQEYLIGPWLMGVVNF